MFKRFIHLNDIHLGTLLTVFRKKLVNSVHICCLFWFSTPLLTIDQIKVDFSSEMQTHREQKCADIIGTVLVPWAGHFQCLSLIHI